MFKSNVKHAGLGIQKVQKNDAPVCLSALEHVISNKRRRGASVTEHTRIDDGEDETAGDR
jgi:hypothetical protein